VILVRAFLIILIHRIGRHAYKNRLEQAIRHSLEFALNRALLKIFGALSKDTYKDICNYFGIWPIEEQISARQDKFNLKLWFHVKIKLF